MLQIVGFYKYGLMLLGIFISFVRSRPQRCGIILRQKQITVTTCDSRASLVISLDCALINSTSDSLKQEGRSAAGTHYNSTLDLTETS